MEHKLHSYKFMAISGWALTLILLCASITHGTWSSPTANPAGNNLSAPINVGSSVQSKTGALTLNGAFNATNNSLFGGNVTFTPSVNGASTFNVTNAAGTSMLKINSTAGTSTIGPLSLTGVIGSLLGTEAKFNVGNSNSTYNLDVTGTARATGNVRSDAGFCISADCITTWPTSSGSVPETGIVLSETTNNPKIISAGFTQLTQDTTPYTMYYWINGMPAGHLYVYKKNP